MTDVIATCLYVVSVLATRNSTTSPISCDVTTAAHWPSVVVAPLSTACSECGGGEGMGRGEGGGETEGHDCRNSKRREEERKDVNRKVMERKKKGRHI